MCFLDIALAFDTCDRDELIAHLLANVVPVQLALNLAKWLNINHS